MLNSTSEETCLFFPHSIETLFTTDSYFYTSKVVATINCVSSPVSAVGNVIILMAIITTPPLHTPANILIAALAFSDLVLGAVVQPIYLAFMVDTDLFLDCTLRDKISYIGIVFAGCSVMLMAAVSCERFLALFYPLRYPTFATNKRALMITVLIMLFWNTLVLITGKFGHIPLIIGVITWCLSYMVITFSYIKIFFLVRRHRHQIQTQLATVQANNNHNEHQNNAVTASQMKLAVTMGYIIWGSLLFSVPSAVVFKIFLERTLSELLFSCGLLGIAIHLTSSALNPLVCFSRMPELRRAAKKRLSQLCQLCQL